MKMDTNIPPEEDVERYIARQLRTVRKTHDITQQQLAAILDISYQQIGKYEASANRIHAARLFQISKVVSAPIQQFFPAPTVSKELNADEGLQVFLERYDRLSPKDRSHVFYLLSRLGN